MLLRPRKFAHKTLFKRRKIVSFKKSKLNYGQYGLRILQPLWVNNKQIFRYKLLLKKASKRSDKTSRKVWFNLFPHLPLTRKVEGSRMGKGKGKLAGWVAQLSPGTTMFEFKNLRTGRAYYYYEQVAHRLPVKSTFIKKISIKIPTILSSTRKVSYECFW